MCCFSGPVRAVSATRIFGRVRSDGVQTLAYEMRVSAARELAMILPLPVAPGSGERAVAFLDLSAYPKLFDDLDRAFPRPPIPRGAALPLDLSAGLLDVHDVGDFVASYVPSVGAFSRLDPRFRMDPAIWSQLPALADWGFAVFQLKGLAARGGEKRFHPMAFSFPSRAPERVFFPTLHVHQGRLEARAHFDHRLYAQLPASSAVPAGWQASQVDAQDTVALSKTQGLVVAGRVVRATVQGMSPNRDTWVG